MFDDYVVGLFCAEVSSEDMYQEYVGMRNDPAQREVMKDWELTIGDGLDPADSIVDREVWKELFDF
jgi:hypothetical protein